MVFDISVSPRSDADLVATMAAKKPRYMISADNGVFDATEDFRFGKRFQTRLKATTL
jgi:hypothetical protein